jgi:hypothetical protein
VKIPSKVKLPLLLEDPALGRELPKAKGCNLWFPEEPGMALRCPDLGFLEVGETLRVSGIGIDVRSVAEAGAVPGGGRMLPNGVLGRERETGIGSCCC